MEQGISETQRKDLEVRFGAAYNVSKLIEFDHKSPEYRRKLPHGPEFAGTCSLCASEAARALVIERREELVQNELIGETVWVRSWGYKTMRKATVEVIEVSSRMGLQKDHYVKLNWEGEARPSRIEKIPRLDVVIEGERLNVWDDGTEDLKPWERDSLSTSARPCEKKYISEADIDESD